MMGSAGCASTGAASAARNERLVTISGKNISLTPEIATERFEIFASGLDHPECLAFDREGNLWAGGEAGQIYRIDSSGVVTTVASLGGFNAGLAFSPLDQSLYVCNSQLGIFRVEANGSHSLFATQAGENKIVCPNYLVFDRRGMLYVTDSGKRKQQNG